MTNKIKSFFLTSAKPENFNRITAIALLIGSVLVFVGIVILNFLFLKFRSSFEVFNEYNVPTINFLFNDFYVIITVFLFFVLYALAILPGMLKQKKWAYYGFLLFNALLILINLSFIYFGKLFNADVLYIAEIINYMPEETEQLLFSLNCSYFFQGIALSLLHVWLIWRYGQKDVKGYFMIAE